MYLDEIPEFAQLPFPFKGLLYIASSAPSSLVVTGLRTQNNERGDLLLTSTVAADKRSANPASMFVVPHFANGSGYATQFVIMRTNAASATPVQVFDASGLALQPQHQP